MSALCRQYVYSAHAELEQGVGCHPIVQKSDRVHPNSVGLLSDSKYFSSHFIGARVHTVLASCSDSDTSVRGSSQAKIGVRIEAIITQLVFEHALRMRIGDQSDGAQRSQTGPDTPASRSTTRVPTPGSSDSDDEATANETNGVTPAKGKNNEWAPDASHLTSSSPNARSGSGSSLTGKINNIISTDLDNLIAGAQVFLLIAYSPIKIGLSIWFLYVILGWRSVISAG